MDDQEALALLDRVYTSANGYIDASGQYAHHVPATLPPERLRELAARGLAPNTFRTFTHEEAVARLRKLAATVDERAAADAFVASLGSAPVRWRTLLPATALGAGMPAHTYPTAARRRTCDVCFVDETVTVDVTQSWWRRADQSPLPGDVCQYVLGLAAAPPPPWPTPEPHDVWVLHEILDVLRTLPPPTRLGGAVRALRTRDLLHGRSARACQDLLEDLAFLGVLQTPSHPGMLTRFTTARERDQRPSARVEVSAPLSFWTAAHGVTEPLVDRLFGHLTRPATRPMPPPQPRRPATAAATRAAPLAPALRGEPRAGDVYAIGCREDAWVLAYCHEVKEHRGRPYGLVEYLDGFFTHPPTASDVTGRGFRGRPNGRWQHWTSALDKTPRVRRLTRDTPRPEDDRPAPHGLPAGTAKDLSYLAESCFPELAG